jgi:hypothetical protein
MLAGGPLGVLARYGRLARPWDIGTDLTRSLERRLSLRVSDVHSSLVSNISAHHDLSDGGQRYEPRLDPVLWLLICYS